MKVLLLMLALCPPWLGAQQAAPTYQTLGRTPHEFDLFANAGWDGSWYIGYNAMWIVKLPPPPQDDNQYVRAYIGAKIGRAKYESTGGALRWTRTPIPCDIHIGIASKPSWKSSESFYLTSCEDLPLEGDHSETFHGQGESRWYWTEVPLNKVNFENANYLALWSNTPGLVSASSSPILAATIATGPVDAWINHSIQGVPPLNPEDALESNISYFAPALAIKLVPPNEPVKPSVELVSFKESPQAYLWEVQVQAKNFERVRAEVSIDASRWVPFGKSYFLAPFQVVASRDRILRELSQLVPGNRKVEQAYLRITAWDEWGNTGSTDNFIVLAKD